jgi:hypothetical protein
MWPLVAWLWGSPLSVLKSFEYCFRLAIVVGGSSGSGSGNIFEDLDGCGEF